MTDERHLGQRLAQAGLSLLFAPGERPSSAEVTRAILHESNAHAPAAITHQPDPREGWLELLASGMTFDLSALAPSPPAQTPAPRRVYGIDHGQIHAGFEAIRLVPGPHIAGGGAMLPVVRVMTELAAELARLLGAKGVIWNPAETLIEPGYFRRVVQNWVSGGVFPALGLVAIEVLPEGGVTSFGLDFFIGQEVIVHSRSADDRTVATKLAARAIDDLVGHGSLEANANRRCIDDEAIRLVASSDGRRVMVSSAG